MKFVRLVLIPALSIHAAELRFCLRTEPKTFDPALVEDDASQAIRYLTGGVLMRVNRATQELEPELALSWKIGENGRAIALKLRENVRFSDGSPFTSGDVAFTFKRLMDPAMHSATGDTFRSGEGKFEATPDDPYKITLRFPAPVAGLDRALDQVAVVSAHSSNRDAAVLGPFRVKEYKTGAYVLLERNPNYWKRDSAGRPLPYLDSIRLDIQQNREIELLRFERGEIQMINTLEPEHFERLAARNPREVFDSGPGMDSEFFWFNQAPASPIPAYKKAWFQSAAFRKAISESINRADIARIVYRGHATPAGGPVSPANRLWINSAVKPPAYQPEKALHDLAQAGFKFSNRALADSSGHRVEFTIVTNSGNPARARDAAMMQQDLLKIGVKLNIATLDFPALLERMNKTLDYEAVLLGLVDVDIDPNMQMDVWLSSSSMHPWYPKEPKPATAWEDEIDRLMRAQASALDYKKRKAAFDRVQQIAADQSPIIYLVNKNVLSAVSPVVKGAHPVALSPQTFWNAERLTIDSVLQSRR
ncbi:MAG TPA: ABC transporter substrate-binding protein [Bryobacteraceae bacterium]|nr:ABC transporter substrate-binding protein [Bryobacteraceae bacterium]